MKDIDFSTINNDPYNNFIKLIKGLLKQKIQSTKKNNTSLINESNESTSYLIRGPSKATKNKTDICIPKIDKNNASYINGKYNSQVNDIKEINDTLKSFNIDFEYIIKTSDEVIKDIKSDEVLSRIDNFIKSDKERLLISRQEESIENSILTCIGQLYLKSLKKEIIFITKKGGNIHLSSEQLKSEYNINIYNYNKKKIVLYLDDKLIIETDEVEFQLKDIIKDYNDYNQNIEKNTTNIQEIEDQIKKHIEDKTKEVKIKESIRKLYSNNNIKTLTFTDCKKNIFDIDFTKIIEGNIDLSKRPVIFTINNKDIIDLPMDKIVQNKNLFLSTNMDTVIKTETNTGVNKMKATFKLDKNTKVDFYKLYEELENSLNEASFREANENAELKKEKLKMIIKFIVIKFVFPLLLITIFVKIKEFLHYLSSKDTDSDNTKNSNDTNIQITKDTENQSNSTITNENNNPDKSVDTTIINENNDPDKSVDISNLSKNNQTTQDINTKDQNNETKIEEIKNEVKIKDIENYFS